MAFIRFRHLMLLIGIGNVAFQCSSSCAQAPWQVPAAYWINNPYAPPANGYYPVTAAAPVVTYYRPPLGYPSPLCVPQVAPGNNGQNHNSLHHFSPEQKLAIVKQHLLEGVPVDQLCARIGIRPDEYYSWQERVFANGAAALEENEQNGNGKQNSNDSANSNQLVEQLEKQLSTNNEFIERLMEECVRAKKQN
jgi:transposase